MISTICLGLFGVGRCRKDHVCKLGTLITETTDVDNKSVLGDVLSCDIVVTANKEYDFRLVRSWFELHPEFQSIYLPLTSVQDIQSIPSFLLTYHSEGIGDVLDFLEDGLTVKSG
jgi:hypothetical protein